MLSAGNCRHRTREQGGYTLMELLVVIAVLGIIMTPLTASFIAMIKNTGEANERVTRDAELQRIGELWTRDVQSVAADGVNEFGSLGASCGSANGPVVGEVELVSFIRDRDAAAGGVIKSSTWVATGTGRNINLVRRYCEDGLPSSEQTLAKKLGTPGASITSIIKGPPTSPAEFCPAETTGVKLRCTIVVDSIAYGGARTITVSRRVPDVRTAVAIPRTPPPPTITNHEERYLYVVPTWAASVLGSGQPPVTDYSLELYGDPDGSPLFPATIVPAGTLSISLTGLTIPANPAACVSGAVNVSGCYYLKMRAKNAIGWGDYTSAYGPMQPRSTAPDKPTIVSATPLGTPGAVRVRWTPNATDGGSAVTSWSAQAFLQTGGSLAATVTLTNVTAVGGDFTGDFSGLTDFNVYKINVAGVNGVGVGVYSELTGEVMPYSNTAFVASTGTNSGNCTLAAPCLTIDYGQTSCKAVSGCTTIAVSAGAYAKFNLQAGLLVWGGFPSGFQASSTGTTTVNGSYDSGVSTAYAIRANAVTTAAVVRRMTVAGGNVGSSQTTQGVLVTASSGPITLQSLDVNGGTGDSPAGVAVSGSTVAIQASTVDSGTASGSGVSTYGVRASASSTVSIATSTITSRAGTAGLSTSQPSAATSGNAGGSGSGASAGSAGSGSGSGSNGGAGGGGGTGGGAAGTTGSGSGGSGGSGGSSGGFKGDGGNRGYQGGAGGPGAAGSAGAAANSNYGNAYGPTSGGAGTNGGNGKGGGGGGAGGAGCTSFACVGSKQKGGGGGGGGQGGTGGTGSPGASGGGGSFGLYSAASTITVDNGTTITTASGGNGGAAGNGGSGGQGGAGGNGAGGESGGGGGNGGAAGGNDGNNGDSPSGWDYSGAGGGAGGGSGGNGGNGGRGGGGAGGPSIAMLSKGTGGITFGGNVGTQVTIGSAGGGGAGGNSGGGGTAQKTLVIP